MKKKNYNGFENMHEKFLSRKHVVNENGCWEYEGCYADYPKLRFDGVTHSCHRISFEIYKGEIPMGRLICHTCNNKRCFNPDHLYAGTREDNGKDMSNDTKSKYPNGKPYRDLNLRGEK